MKNDADRSWAAATVDKRAPPHYACGTIDEAMNFRKVIGWFLFAFGIAFCLYAIVGSAYGAIIQNIVSPGSGASSLVSAIIVGLAVGGVFILVGWLLVHPKKRSGDTNPKPPDEPAEQ